ncbi:MAG: hypothetical protein GF331_24130 [Chitinivibrionales bacterium]|nr:hypothetical protein [Chitinivibrionales bacterium]
MHRTTLTGICWAAAACALELPLDEMQAMALLAEGALDSNAWVALAPFYVEPLSVPDGELPALAAALPELAGMPLPAEPQELAAYEPWSPQAVQRFFRDHPHLLPAAPILSFEPRSQLRRWGWASLRLRGKGTRLASSQYLSALLEPYRAVRVTLRGMRGADGLWAMQRRSLRVRMGAAGEVVLGDFSPRLDEGLLTGRFGHGDTDTLGHVGRLLYGSSKGYNGALWRSGGRSRVEAEAFCHRDHVLWAYGGNIGVHLSRPVEIRTGVTGYAFAGGDSGRAAVHAGVKLRSAVCAVGVGCCLPVAPLSLPAWRTVISHENDRARIRAEMVHIPADFPGRMGRVSAWVADDNGSPEGRTGLAIRMHLRLLEHVSVSPAITYACGRGTAACRASVGLAGGFPFEYRFSYDYRPDPGAVIRDRHTARGRISHMFGDVFGAGMDCRLYARGRSYWSFSSRVFGALELAMGTWEPFVAYRRASEGLSEYAVGLRQEARVGDVARGTLSMELPVSEEGIRDALVLHVSIRLVF